MMSNRETYEMEDIFDPKHPASVLANENVRTLCSNLQFLFNFLKFKTKNKKTLQRYFSVFIQIIENGDIDQTVRVNALDLLCSLPRNQCIEKILKETSEFRNFINFS